MFYRDHEPPHFHAKHGEYEVTVEIETGLIQGEFPKGALAHVLKWYLMHKKELLEDWDLARDSKPLRKITPLE